MGWAYVLIYLPMLRLGAGYMFDKTMMEQYEKEGIDYIKSDLFWDEYQISVKQFQYDTKYLYGCCNLQPNKG